MSKSNDWWLIATEAQIIQELKECCAMIPPGETRSTKDIVELAFPVLSARGAGIERRNGLFSRLTKSSHIHFQGFFTRGEPKANNYGRTVRAYLWHAPKAICLACNGTGLA